MGSASLSVDPLQVFKALLRNPEAAAEWLLGPIDPDNCILNPLGMSKVSVAYPAINATQHSSNCSAFVHWVSRVAPSTPVHLHCCW